MARLAVAICLAYPWGICAETTVAVSQLLNGGMETVYISMPPTAL